MVKKGHFGCFRVVTINTVTIPANQEVVIPGNVCVPAGEQLLNCESIIEPVERSTNNIPAVVGRDLVTSTDTCCGRSSFSH